MKTPTIALAFLLIAIGWFGMAEYQKLDKTWALVYYSGASPTHIGHDAFVTRDACQAVQHSASAANLRMIDDTQYQCVPVWYVREAVKAESPKPEGYYAQPESPK